MKDSPNIVVNREIWKALLDSQHRLRCLVQEGVGNWDGFESAMEQYQKEVKGDEEHTNE